MKFFCLHEARTGSTDKRLSFFSEACQMRGIEFVSLDSAELDFTQLPTPTKNDFLYNACRGSEFLEALLLNDEVTTLYLKNPIFIEKPKDSVAWSITHARMGLPVPKTIYHVNNDRQQLRKYVNSLGGFPVILKVTGSTRCMGVIKIDSFHNLISTVEYLNLRNESFVLREHIANNGTARLVVLGEEVIASTFRENLKDDFRVSGQNIATISSPRIFSPEIVKLSVLASRALNFEFAGVDVIIDKDEKPYVIEVNSPHDFVPVQEVTGVAIALQTIDFLIRKQQARYQGGN